MINPAKYKVIFISEDGVKFKLFVDGSELRMTRGVTITAGIEKEVEVTPTLLALKGLDTFKPPLFKSNK